MTSQRWPNGTTISCDTEGCGNSLNGLHPNPVNAQRAAKAFFGWRTYKDGDKWKHSCLKCTTEWRNKQLLKDKSDG